MNKILLILVIFLFACQTPDKSVKKEFAYPDIAGFFKAEIKRLSKEKPTISKEVHLNKNQETKLSNQINWEEELNIFLASDINKPAFKGLYKKHVEDGELVFSASDPKLKTRELKILKDNTGKIKRITITNHSENLLYTTDDYLEYCPDLVYQIVKRQEVKIIGTNNYWILGRFKQ